MFDKLKKTYAEWKQRLQEEKQKSQQAAANARVANLKDKGELIGDTPNTIACTITTEGCHTFISCIFLSVGGRIYAQDRIKPKNRFKTKLTNGKTAIWSIVTKDKEMWKFETCHNVKGIFVGYVA
jgi:hypothetical protein